MADQSNPSPVHSAPAAPAAPAPAPPQVIHLRNPDHTLTRFGMEDVLRGGGSVEYKGRVITKPEHLPTAAQLAEAAGNPAELGRVRDDLEGRLKAMQAELDAVKAAQKSQAAAAQQPPARTPPAK